ncbi:MAG: FtsW/RodA/SpoVE family cell cycle protein [Pirellulales bacterium]|nr:FtsW/RodA/SpoVE family cell cycle protein [Pirellulales bacterium]
MDGSLFSRPFPLSIVLPGAAIMASGIAVLHRSEQITESSGRLLPQQLVWMALGLFLAGSVVAIGYRCIARWSATILLVAIAALIAVYVFPPVNGAHRWIRFGSVGLQPSEFAKLAYILALARYAMHRDLSAGFSILLPPLAMAIVPMLLILPEPDLGTSLVFLPVMFAMLFAAGARQRDLFRLTAAGLLLVPLLWSQMSREQRSRITALGEQNGPHDKPTADGFHLDQAKRMFAAGGFCGSLFAIASDDDFPPCRVPEPFTDSVFCVLGERFGLLGCGVLLLLFGLLIHGCVGIAAVSDEPFGRLVAVGVAALFATEVLVNTGMLAGLLPITGLSLPLVSYGGSGLIAHLISLGLVASIARR